MAAFDEKRIEFFHNTQLALAHVPPEQTERRPNQELAHPTSARLSINTGAHTEN